MLLRVVRMLKKKPGIEAFERDWSWGNRVVEYFKISSTLNIPEGCEKIGKDAFVRCWWLKKVRISESVKKIGNYAFWKCKNTTIILRKPENEFEEIGDQALIWCDVLEEYAKEETRN